MAAAAGLGGHLVDVIACECPANQPAVGDAVDSQGTRHGRLRLSGIGSDDLQVGPGTEREQRVVSAETDVLAAGLALDAEAFLQISDRSDEVGGGIDEVVNQHLNLTSIQVAQVETRWAEG